MQGIRFINEICKKFNLKVTSAFEARSSVFNNRNCRKCNLIYYELDPYAFSIWIAKYKIAVTWSGNIFIYRFCISEKYKVLQKINERLCEELDS